MAIFEVVLYRTIIESTTIEVEAADEDAAEKMGRDWIKRSGNHTGWNLEAIIPLDDLEEG